MSRVRIKQPAKRRKLDDRFFEKAESNFYQNPLNNIAKNAVAAVGPYNAAFNNEECNKVNHVFLTSLKPAHIKATNQENSGRCWMFAGLNIYRYLLINALDLDNFEFSETYLFFYDKIERANYIIQYFIDNKTVPEERVAQMLLDDYYNDGGYWNYFSNLVDKYGLIPKECMQETANSVWTSDMNTILNERIVSCIHKIVENNSRKRPDEALNEKYKKQTMQCIYDCVVKFLGEPPKTFDWYFTDKNKEAILIKNLTPTKFYNMVKTIDVTQFITLIDIPYKPYYKTYTIDHRNNMIGGAESIYLNVPIDEIKKYCVRSIEDGLCVWFAGDANKGLDFYKSVLNEKIYDTESLFGKTFKWSKGDKLRFGFTRACHAMTLTGVNFDAKGNPEQWQVENSWGYIDHEVPGRDGFFTMSNKWFEDNLTQAVVYKSLLSRNLLKCLKEDPTVLDPWESVAIALNVK